MVGIVARGAATTSGSSNADEDAITLAVAAAQAALADAAFLSRDEIGVVYLATLGEPLKGRPGSGVLRDVLDLNPGCHVADLLAGQRSGTEALFAVENLVKPSVVRYGLVVVADDPMSCAAGQSSAAVAFLLGRQKEEMLATLDFETGTRVAATLRDATQTMTQAPAMSRSVADGVVHLIREVWLRKRLKASDLRWVLLQEPYPGFCEHAADALGLTQKQVTPPDWAAEIPGTAATSPLVGLTTTLDQLEPGERVMIASAAPGFGVDTFLFTATEHLSERRTGKMPMKNEGDD